MYQSQLTPLEIPPRRYIPYRNRQPTEQDKVTPIFQNGNCYKFNSLPNSR